MIHVTLIAGTYQPQRCGVAHYTQRLRQELRQRDVATTVLTTYEAASAVNGSPQIKGVVKDWSVPQLLPLVRALLTTPTDFLHIQHAAGSYRFERSLFLLPLLLRALGYRPPLVVTLHEYGWWDWQPKWLPAAPLEWLKQAGQRRGWWDQEDGFLITGSRATVVTNAEAADVLSHRLPCRALHFIPIAANVDVMANACAAANTYAAANACAAANTYAAANAYAAADTLPGAASPCREDIRIEMRSRFGWPQDAEVVAFFGFLHPTKGLETLLPAFQQVQRQCPQARLLVMGGVRSLALGDEADWYWDKLHAEADNLGLWPNVAFTGYQDAEAVSAHLLGADLGVLPFNHGVTLKSGSLLALLAHGLPTIATTASPPDPSLTDHLLQLVPPKRPEAIATAIATLLNAPDRRDRLRQAGLTFARQFSWEAIVSKHVDLYQTLLS
ncbi:MAG: glycosyltransferase family 4 protein [Elainellaceae cyanobacterium]